MATILVIAFSAGQNSGAEPSKPAGLSKAPEHHCTARKAVKFYAGRIAYWGRKMGAETRSLLPRVSSDTPRACPRYLSRVLRSKAYASRKAYFRWVEHEYHWWKWLPAKFQRVGRCETGGTPGATSAGNWSWDSGTYVSAFGIIRAAFPTWNGHNTPREQYEVAASIQARYGWGAWGCGGA